MWQWVDLFIKPKTKHLITFNRIYMYLSELDDNAYGIKYKLEKWLARLSQL